jgi:Mg2+ and Co2+ transporter CorA
MRHTRLYRQGMLEAKDFPAAQISDFLEQPDTVVWLDLCEPDQQDLEVVSQEFGLHPLAVEDAVQQHERPKLDRYQDHYFLTAYAVSLAHDTGQLITSELAAFITPRALITVRKDTGFDIEGVVQRWDGSADLADHGVGFLLWGLLDFVVDGHFATVQQLDEALEGLEDLLFDDRPTAPRCNAAPLSCASRWWCCAGWCCPCGRSSTASCAVTWGWSMRPWARISRMSMTMCCGPPSGPSRCGIWSRPSWRPTSRSRATARTRS